MLSLTSSAYSGGTRSERRRPISSTRSTPTKLANWRFAYRITSRCTSTASWMRSPRSANSFGASAASRAAAGAARGRRGARQQVVDRGHHGGDFGLIAVDLQPPGQAAADGDALQLLGYLLHG